MWVRLCLWLSGGVGIEQFCGDILVLCFLLWAILLNYFARGCQNAECLNGMPNVECWNAGMPECGMPECGMPEGGMRLQGCDFSAEQCEPTRTKRPLIWNTQFFGLNLVLDVWLPLMLFWCFWDSILYSAAIFRLVPALSGLWPSASPER